MLVLTRRKGEDIRIGDDIVLKVTDIRGGQVSMGIEAPDHLSVDRQEVAIRKRQLSAATNTHAPGEIPPRPM